MIFKQKTAAAKKIERVVGPNTMRERHARKTALLMISAI
jgi:hypothetical protein